MFFLFTNKKKKKMTNRSQSRDAWQHNNNQKIRWSAFRFSRHDKSRKLIDVNCRVAAAAGQQHFLDENQVLSFSARMLQLFSAES
jgi:hypothetical protein